MKKRKKLKLGRVIIISIILISIFFCIKDKNNNKTETINDLVNISECSEEFIEEYYDGIKELKENENKENILIVISKNKIPDGTHGANKVIEAPNNQYILQYDSEEEKNKALESLKQDNNIISAEENIQYTLAESNFNSWGIEATGLDKAMEAAEGRKLDDVTVAIIDTGCDVDMINTYFPSKIIETYNILNENDNTKDITDVTDNHGHGTRMAEIIAEGTSSNVKILPIKVSEGKTLDTIDIIAAMNYIIYKNENNIGQKVDIVNMSFVTYSYSKAMIQVINAATAQDTIVVAAAGNDYTSQKAYPAAYDNTLSIGACDSTLKRLPEPYDFSNYGSTLDFIAPGVNILGLDGKAENAMSGTSTSAPHVASAIAMIKGYNKNYTYEEVFEILKANAVDIGEKGRDNYYGYGLINLAEINYCSCDCNDCDIIYCFGCECQECICKDNVEENENIAKEYECEWEYEIISQEEKTIRLTKCKIVGEYDGVSKVKITVPEKLKIKNQETQEEVEYTVKEMSGKIQSGSAINVFPSINLETIVLPDTITKIGDCTFAFQENLKNINLPEGLITIGGNAFYNCYGLEEITFPETLENIGSMAFMSCTNLKKINIEKNVKSISDGAFLLCTALEEIEVDSSNPNYDNRENCNALIDTQNNRLLIGTSNTIRIPDTVKTIALYAFANNFKLPYVEIPEGVEEVEDLAFYNCVYAQEITLPKSLETIGENAFAFTSATIWVYKDSKAKEYLVDNELAYKCIDPTTIDVYVADKEYEAFEKVNTEGMYITLKYDDGREEKIEENINIKYQNEELDSFRAGDTYFKVNTINSVGQYIVTTVEIEEEVEVVVNKAKPNITEEIPTELKAKYGDKLSDVIIGNDRFTWKEPEKVIDKIGTVEFEAIYTPEDTQNYETVEVKINVEVRKADPDITDKIPTGLTAKYGDNLSDIILPDGFSWEDEGTVGNVGENTFKIKYTPKDEEKEYYNEIEGIEVTITVSQAIPEYEIPTNLNAKYGDKLSDVTIEDDRFSWKNPEEIIDQIGEVEFDAIYTPIDTQNYETVNLKIKVLVEKAEIDYVCEKDYEYDGQPHSLKITINKPDDAIVKFMDENGEYTLDNAPEFTQIGDYEIKYKIYANDNFETVEETQILKIFKKIEIINSTTDYEGIYDGKEHSIKININTSNYTIRYSVNNKNYNLTELPKFKDVGEYTINYKITVENHEDIVGSNKVRIYGIKSIDSSIGQKGNILIIKDYNSSFKNLSSKIKLYAKSSTYKHFDVDNTLVNTDTTKTGDKIKVNINGVKDFEHQISILGDVNGDGKISALDYVKIKNHIMKTTLINSDVYLIAADVNDDGKISALDYVRIKNYIMNGGK